MIFIFCESNKYYDFIITIDFHEYQIGGILRPTRNIFDVENENKILKCGRFFILQWQYFPYGSRHVVNFELMKVDWSKIMTCSILYCSIIHFQKWFPRVLAYHRGRSLRGMPTSNAFEECFFTSAFQECVSEVHLESPPYQHNPPLGSLAGIISGDSCVWSFL